LEDEAQDFKLSRLLLPIIVTLKSLFLQVEVGCGDDRLRHPGSRANSYLAIGKASCIARGKMHLRRVQSVRCLEPRRNTSLHMSRLKGSPPMRDCMLRSLGCGPAQGVALGGTDMGLKEVAVPGVDVAHSLGMPLDAYQPPLGEVAPLEPLYHPVS
jgi:hypothetical protein